MAKVDPNEPITRKILDEAVEAILDGINRMFTGMNKRFDGIDARFDNLEAGQRILQRKIKDLKYNVPTRKEFNELKARVDKYHPQV